jgi:HPt (histidine-containing phosphotransfer) domain-containing protein
VSGAFSHYRLAFVHLLAHNTLVKPGTLNCRQKGADNSPARGFAWRAICRLNSAAASAHTLKSSALAVGALALGELCTALEEEGRAGDRDALTVLLPRFEVEMAAVERDLAHDSAPSART